MRSFCRFGRLAGLGCGFQRFAGHWVHVREQLGELRLPGTACVQNLLGFRWQLAALQGLQDDIMGILRGCSGL